MNTQKRNLCAAGVLLTAAATMVVLFLFRLSQPDKAQQSIFLNCTASDRGGWTFYTEAGQTEPVFGFGGYIDGVPAEGAGPVVAERIMEEPGERCFLQFSCVNAGLQVFLEDILLYTDFPQQENRVDVFLQNADFAGINYNGLCIPLPLDCAGKALRIVTYGPSLNGLRVPVFPSQASRFSDAVVQTTGVVWCMTAVTVRLMLALSLLLVLVLGAQAGQPLWKLLPLSGYFLLAAVSGVCNTFLESASGLNADSGLLNWVYLIHMDFLYIYLAAELRGKKRWGLAATALLHILLTALQSFAAVPLLTEKVGDWLGFSFGRSDCSDAVLARRNAAQNQLVPVCGCGLSVFDLGCHPLCRRRSTLSVQQPGNIHAGRISARILCAAVQCCRPAVRCTGSR